ncbi:hypothetical protein TruAng_011501 [Truncatella angustata]|nr:hypothetical protein TruAng_011501 [Truncatella angustata]
MGYAEVLESTQLALIATVHKLYAMVRNGQQWDLAEPELNDRGQPIIHNIATLLGSIRSNADADLPPHTVFPEDEGGLAKLAAELELPQQDSNMVPIKLETDFACSRTERASSSELDHSDSGQDYRNTVMSSQNVQPDYPESFTSYNDFYTNTVPTEMDPSAMFPVQSNTNPAAVPSWKMARPTQWALLPNNFILSPNQVLFFVINMGLDSMKTSSEVKWIRHLIPYLVNVPTPERMLNVTNGQGPALQANMGVQVPQWAPAFGVVDGPYARHLAKWLISDPKFDGIRAPTLVQPENTRTWNSVDARFGRNSTEKAGVARNMG